MSVPPHPAPPSRAQAGQASLEYAGVLAVVAVALVVAASFAGGGTLVNGVVRGLERALCVVTGGPCDEPPLEACTLRSSRTAGRVGVELTLVRVGTSLAIVREELSDGTTDVSLVDTADAAPTAGLGGAAGVTTGGKRHGIGGVVSVDVSGELSRRTTWNVRGSAAADRLVKRIVQHVATSSAERALAVPVIGGAPSLLGRAAHKAAHLAGYHGDELPPADVEAVDVRVDAALGAAYGDLADARAGVTVTASASRDRRTGVTQVVLGLRGDASAALARALDGPRIQHAVPERDIRISYDREGRAVELVVVRTGVPAADLGLADAGGSLDVTSRLDLRQPANHALLDGVLAALHPGRARRLPGAVTALGERLRTGGRMDATRYVTQQREYGADAEAAVGARLGGSLGVSRTRSRLTGAWTRPAGGVWEARTDCLPGATAT